MKKLKTIFFIVVVFSCASSDDVVFSNLLNDYLNNRTIETGAVIACAASDQETNAVLAFYYPENGASNIRFYETNTTDVDKLDYSKYKRIDLESDPFFNGYLGKFTRVSQIEKWIIITYELNNEIKISNPIRSKQITKPTVWNENVTINTETTLMPKFTWPNNAFGDNAIYFEVIATAENNLLSGTYTYENNFQYYNTSNVVLNITNGEPSQLIQDAEYNFTLMDVSEDNWVNLVTRKTFIAQ
ncbi:hypothetical protein [uncultured Lacinutrix sp.]|uniref:hypothetical protein n=1 Tax=uncultured Lacinutrix sp. TaxID=574032 RepID=UPI00261D27F3|nr:hypothetical protein [uncultured Lacinutrix sp.]